MSFIIERGKTTSTRTSRWSVTLENLQKIGDMIKESSQRNLLAQPMIALRRCKDEGGANYTSKCELEGNLARKNRIHVETPK